MIGEGAMKKFFLFILAIIIIAAIFSDNDKNDSESPRYSEKKKEAITVQQRDRDKDYFSQHKKEILEKLQKLLKDGKYLEARNLSKKYLFLEDANITQLYKKADDNYKILRIKQILAQLKKIPASNYAKNKGLYQELRSLDPSNKAYKKKFEYYSKKLDDQQQYKRLVREGLAWNYETSKDHMTEKLIKRAFVRSMNTVNFNFPYGGGAKSYTYIT